MTYAFLFAANIAFGVWGIQQGFLISPSINFGVAGFLLAIKLDRP